MAASSQMAAHSPSDVFCFCTPPHLRVGLVRDGIAQRRAPDRHGKAGGAHQRRRHGGPRPAVRRQGQVRGQPPAPLRRTLPSKTHELIASGALGRIHTVYGTATGWMMHMISHLIDYTRWFKRRSRGRVGDGAGGGARQSWPTSTPSPDYIAGFIHYANGVHGVIECGAGAPRRSRGRLLVAEVPYGRTRARRLRRGPYRRRRLARWSPGRVPFPAPAA